MARSAIIYKKLPSKVLPFAIATAMEIYNYLPTEVNKNGISPYKKLMTALNCQDTKPPLQYLRAYSYTVWIHIKAEYRK